MDLDATDNTMMAGKSGATTVWARLFLPVFTVYTLGLVVWLALGLLPTLADSLAPVRHWAQSLAISSSPLAGTAARILDANQSMPGMALEAANRGSVALAYIFSVLNLVMGVILAARRPHQLVPCLLAFALVGTAATLQQAQPRRLSYYRRALAGQNRPFHLPHRVRRDLSLGCCPIS